MPILFSSLTNSADLIIELTPGERVLWRGKPERGPFVRRTWPFSVFGGALLAAFFAYEVTVLTTEAPDLLALWGIPFLLAALYMVVGHFLVTAREWRNTEYLVTNSRVLLRHGLLSPKLTAYSLSTLPHTLVVMTGKGVGNIMFKPAFGKGYGPGPGYRTMWPYPPGYLLGLMYISNPQQVQATIEKARSGGF